MNHHEGTHGWFYNYHSDLSGDVDIFKVDGAGSRYMQFSIPGEDFVSLVAEVVRGTRISRIESMSDDELLTLDRSS